MGPPTDPGPSSFQTVSPPLVMPTSNAHKQGRTDYSWGPRAIGDHGAPCPHPHLKPHPKKAYERY
ncbi:unnamed protein product [Staurois parvus]|uniref:Uncharacterized protein n=1 Tax=Staurois parvus TaxID=386267 RepID=A0ABN9B202_9NEOB|nr:unnamed protein product [Staurois parvus]